MGKYRILLFSIAVTTACHRKPASQAEGPMDKWLLAYFAPRESTTEDIAGLWRLDNQSASKSIEETFLRDYKPAPNENSPEIIRDRMKSMQGFLRIDNELRMVSLFIAGIADARISRAILRRRGAAYIADFPEQPKRKGVRISYDPVKQAIVITEDNQQILYYRETRNPDQILAELKRRFSGDLPEMY